MVTRCHKDSRLKAVPGAHRTWTMQHFDGLFNYEPSVKHNAFGNWDWQSCQVASNGWHCRGVGHQVGQNSSTVGTYREQFPTRLRRQRSKFNFLRINAYFL